MELYLKTFYRKFCYTVAHITSNPYYIIEASGKQGTNVCFNFPRKKRYWNNIVSNWDVQSSIRRGLKYDITQKRSLIYMMKQEIGHPAILFLGMRL